MVHHTLHQSNGYRHLLHANRQRGATPLHTCTHTHTHTFKHTCTHACLHIRSAVIAWCTHPRVTHPPQTLSRSPHGPRCPPRQSHGWSRRTHPDQPLHASTCLAGQHLGHRCNNNSKNIGMNTTGIKHDATQKRRANSDNNDNNIA